MRVAAIIVIIVAVLGISCMLTAVSMLAEETDRGLSTEELVSCQVHKLFGTLRFRQIYPSLPSWRSLFHFPTGLMAAALVLGAVWILRLRQGRSWLIVALGCLVGWPYIYAFGLIALRDNPDLPRAGLWYATMLLGVFYALLACAAFACLSLIRPAFLQPKAPVKAPQTA